MNIGVDVDGVLANVAEFQLNYGTPYFKKKYGYSVINPNAFDVKEIFGCSDGERNKFGWDKTFWHYIIRYPATENAAHVLNKLRTDGHRIIIITGRVFVTQQDFKGWLYRFTLKNWLKRRKIPYDDIFYCDEHNAASDKILACQKHSIDVMVEDKAENIIALSKFTKVICFDAPYNRNCEGENISRAHNWDEVYQYINRDKNNGK